MRTLSAALVISAVLFIATPPLAAGAPGAPSPDVDAKRPELPAATGREVTPDDIRFHNQTLRPGSPEDADLAAEPLTRLPKDLRAYLEPAPEHPLYAGGVVLAARNGVVAVEDAAGHALRYTDADHELPPEQQVPARTDTIFDLASVTKTFTTIAVLEQLEAGTIELDEPVATYLPDFAANGKASVTVRDLLTHTGGLPAWLPLYSRYDTVAERIAAVLAVEPDAPPGEAYVYSDLGLITLGLLLEEVTGQPLDQVIAEGITEPLGMRDTMFNPPASLLPRIAATEAQPWAGRPMIRGEVHDENAWSLGGIAGHAGLFSTAHDLAVLAQTLLNGGRYGDARILERGTVRAMLTNENTEFPGDSHGLGFELDQRWYMDALSTPVTFGHTGFTGTSFVVDPLAHSFVILLTNRVHPSRDWGSNNPARRAVARDLALATPVRPAEGPDAWFSGVGDRRTATLSLPVPATGAATLDFNVWYDTEAGYDTLTLETSADGGETWRPVPFTVRDGPHLEQTDGTLSGFGGRRWYDATAAIEPPTDTAVLRWRYATDGLYQGRGVYVDGVRVNHEPVTADAFVADGWRLAGY
jgi:CubicO group peptidase (beta-lactamase class C family)